MDFNALREQILANVENYDANESKIVITKLLDFLVDINEKRDQLEIENKQLFDEINDRKHHLDRTNKGKIDEILEKANIEAKSIINQASNIANTKLEDAEHKSQEVVEQTINKLENVVNEIVKLDQESKLYRNHILSIFKKTIFKFSDSKYYLIRQDDKDFNELLNFFEVDKRLQTLCEENIKKLNSIKNYIEIRDSVKNKKNELNIIHSFEEILKGNEINLNENKIEITEEDKKVIENSIQKTEPVILKETEYKDTKETKEPEKGSKKFIEIINKYHNK